MMRTLTAQDLLIEQNRDGNFFYIRPDSEKPSATNIIKDQFRDGRIESLNNNILVRNDNTLVDNAEIHFIQQGIHIKSGNNITVYDYTYFDTREIDTQSSAILRNDDHFGQVKIQRAYADGLDRQIKVSSDYYITNTQFFDNNNYTTLPIETPVYMRDFSAKGFSDAIIDTRGIVYIANAKLEDAYRILRVWEDAHVILVRCEINLGDGARYGQLIGRTARISYYDCLWDGSPTPDMTKFEAFESFTVYSRESAAIVARNVRALTSDPLASIPFFRTDDNRYRAQVSVNHDIWIDLPLPAGGRFADHIGDPLTELPSLGNGLYRVRVWIDGAEGATTPVISRVVEVTDNGFDYRGGQRAPDGGDGADQIAGLATADLIRARGGNDTVDAGDGDDTVDGGEGSDRLTGGRGSDCLIGGGGSDILDGGTQSDRLDGGVGADLLVGGEGDDTLLGGDGNDTLRPGPGSNVMDGGAGFDSIDLSDMPASAGGFLIDIGARFFRPIAGGASQAFAGMEWAVGSAAADRIIGTGNGERITGGRGDDTLEGGFGRDVYIFDPAAGFGADVVVNFQSDDELWFDRFVDPGMDDLIFLDPAGAMWVPGMGGSIDLARPNGFVAYAGVNAEGFHVYRLVFIARPAFDIPATTPIHEDPALIRGGAGSDALVGGSGPDRIDGLGGGDVLRGLGGADALFGGDGADTLDGGDGPDWLLGGSGDDLLRGGVGSDTIEGGDGDDRVIWSDFVDRIAGGNGLDTLDFSEMRAGGVFVDLQTQTVSSLGGLTVSQATFSGIERVTGTASADHLRGLSGADRLTGGLGDDTLDGDTGSDVYIFDNRTFFGRDEVRNFQSNDQFWFADFLDPGADGVIFLDSAGRLSVPTPGGRIATIDTIHDNRMVRYQGVNAEGSHVYVIDYNTRPSRDLLGAYAPSDPGASGVLTVRAAGEAGPGEGPKFLVRIGGVQIGAIEIDPAQSPLSIQQNGLAYRDYSFTHDPTLVGERIDIVFFNDGRDPVTGDDRNLYVDRVVANGRILEAETDGNFTPMWAGGSATPGPREALYWDGTLTF